MELIVFVGALCIAGVLAMRFGHDSRLAAYSKEQDLANLGLSWGSSDQAGEKASANMRRGVGHSASGRSWIRTFSAWWYFRKENAQ